MNENETTQPTQETPPTQNKEGGLGATIASILIILIIVLGAFYFLNTIKAEKKGAMNTNEATAPQEDSASSIEAEFEAENFDDLDKEMEAIEAEFEASAN